MVAPPLRAEVVPRSGWIARRAPPPFGADGPPRAPKHRRPEIPTFFYNVPCSSGVGTACVDVLVCAARAIYLGETFCSYISINNSSSFEAREVIIKVEVQTERQRILLLDTSKSPVESIRSGCRYDFIVEHDVKELGAHTLVCTALYNDGDAERKYLPQFFKFTVSNPLSVRTKVRTIKNAIHGDLCEQLASLPANMERNIADKLDKTPDQILKRLEDMRNKMV